MKVPTFNECMENGELISQDGYHQPQNWSYRRKHCGCDLITGKGAYRDMSFEINGKTVHFYHQTPVVVEENGKYLINSGGYRTSTTKERINRYSPFRVFQEDFEWYVRKDGGILEFEDNMILEA